MDVEPEKICCGDTEFCSQCKLYESAANSDVKAHTLNALGRCDLYSGPDMVTVKMTPPN